MKLRLFTSLSEERKTICKLAEEMTPLKEENENLRDRINAKFSLKDIDGTQTKAVVNEKSALVTVNNELDKANSTNSRNIRSWSFITHQ